MHIRGDIIIPIVAVAAFFAAGHAKPLAHVNRLQFSLNLSTVMNFSRCLIAKKFHIYIHLYSTVLELLMIQLYHFFNLQKLLSSTAQSSQY